MLPEPGAFYIIDRGFIDFERLYRFHQAGSFFVTRGKSNLKASLYEMLQILSLTMFERIPLDQLLAQTVPDEIQHYSHKQLFLFE